METSGSFIKEIKASMKQIEGALQTLEEAEKKQDQARNVRDYDIAQNEAANATLSMMQALEEAVRAASAKGCSNGLYDIHKYHKVVEFNLGD